MRNVFAALSVLLLALGLACGGGGRSNDAPPRHPDGGHESAQRGASGESTPSDARFAQPPGVEAEERAPKSEATDEEAAPEASSVPNAPEPAAPAASGWGA